MLLTDIIAKTGLKVVAGDKGLEREVKGAYVSDLLSDVMGRAKEGELWMTLQTHRNTVAVASLKDLAGIIIVNNHEPDAEMLDQAEKDELPVMVTSLSAFEIAGILYNLLKK